MQATVTLDELHQEEPTTTGKETKQELNTALALREEEVLEGEVTTILEPEQPPPPKQRPYYLIVVVTLLACFLFTGVSLLAPLFTPSATVIIIPRQERISTTESIQLHARLLPALTLSQSTTVPATGKRHLNATRARGTITFYNGLFTSQTIEAGTIVTGADGVQVITDQPAVIPAGNPPTYGQVTVSAHALHAGEQGDIEAYDVNSACCGMSVLAKNATAFQGGAQARDFTVVTQQDMNAAAVPITTILEKSERAALNAELQPSEALILPSCKKDVTADHAAGDEAAQVTVTISLSCKSLAYLAHSLYTDATRLLTKYAVAQLGQGYSLVGSVQVKVLRATVTPDTNTVFLSFSSTGTWLYALTEQVQQHIKALVAGKSKSTALQILNSLPGVRSATINGVDQNTPLPHDKGHIHIVVIYTV